jgi:rsbT antagonist protein RsbS
MEQYEGNIFSRNIVENILIVTIEVDLDEDLLDSIREYVLDTIKDKNLNGVILDISGVVIIDSVLIKKLTGLIDALGIMGTPGIVTGIKPEVAVSIITLGINLESINTALNVEEGFHLLGKMVEM